MSNIIFMSIASKLDELTTLPISQRDSTDAAAAAAE